MCFNRRGNNTTYHLSIVSGAISKHFPVPDDPSLTLLVQYVHSLGITHRDLKPEVSVIHCAHTELWLWVVSHRTFYLPKAIRLTLKLRILDLRRPSTAKQCWRCALVFDNFQSDRTWSLVQTMCGTPAYLAPEIVMQTNMQGYDNLVDSWSVGAIVFSMCVFNDEPCQFELITVFTLGSRMQVLS